MHNDLIQATVFQEYATPGTSLPLFWATYMSGASLAGNVLSGEQNQVYAYGNANGGLVSLQFFDANHVDITSQVDYQFANGAGLSMSSVPEPTSFALLATGLVALLPITRRRKG
jgi:hypothetical protein